MNWRYWPEALAAVLVVVLDGLSWNSDATAAGATKVPGSGWTPQRKLENREKTRELWYHGYDHYMNYAFPLDELTPLSCSGRGPDWDYPQNIAYNDVAGNFSITLIDVLDTLVVLDDRPGFEKAVNDVIHWVQFDVNTKPQVFETTIRALGGLLSAHIFATQVGKPFYLPWYRGELLALARDLGERLLPAFSTPTGIPYARVNLRRGVIKGETTETCTAGAGSLMLEFATLSRLTGDDRFENVARRAFFALWNRRTDIGLVGNTIDIKTGVWIHPEVTGIGAGIDSFYEYALKWYVLSGEAEFLDVWQEAYASIMKFARAVDGFWYRSVNIYTGQATYFTVDSLSAFWPGLQVLAGDVQNAVKSHLMYWGLWRRHSGLPEVWDINYRQATSFQYPLRPEFVESTWYLYRATRDSFYLDVGERILNDVIARARVPCGLTGIQDLRTNDRDDRMESFVLSETLKYLYLLFDEDNPLHNDDSNYVFTTEGHILSLGKEHLKPVSSTSRKTHLEERCPVYYPSMTGWKNTTGLVQGIRSHVDLDYSRELVALLPEKAEEHLWTPYGWCEKPKVDIPSYSFILSPDGVVAAEDVNPGSDKIVLMPDGYILQNMTGIRMHIVKKLDGTGYDISKIGPYVIGRGQVVYINDSTIFFSSRKPDGKYAGRDPIVEVRFSLDVVDPVCHVEHSFLQPSEVLVTGYAGFFGGDLSVIPHPAQPPLRFRQPDGVPIVRDNNNSNGCTPYGQSHDGAAMLLYRGDCTFLEKLIIARAAGAIGVIVISDEDVGINPSASEEDLKAVGDLSDVAILVITRTDGKTVTDMMNSAEIHGMGELKLALQGEPPLPEEDEEDTSKATTNRVLYLNGHPLLNTHLLV